MPEGHRSTPHTIGAEVGVRRFKFVTYICVCGGGAIYNGHLEFIDHVFVQRVISLDLGELGILIEMS